MSDPNCAPLNDTAKSREGATAAQQPVADTAMQDSAGGGGMGGASAAEGALDATRPLQGATPSNPASPAVAGDAASVDAAKEAQRLSLDDSAEPKPLPGQ